MDSSFIDRFQNMDTLDDETRKRLVIEMSDRIDTAGVSEEELEWLLKESENAYAWMFLASVLLSRSRNSRWTEHLLQTCIDAEIPYLEKYFVYTQIGALLFKTPEYNSDKADELMDELYAQVYKGYSDEMDMELSLIPIGERNRNFILVLTGQLLQIQHGPTKTILDRCKLLMQSMGKDIVLINLSMILPFEHIVPLYELNLGSHMAEYDNLENVGYDGVNIPFVQMGNHFPTIAELKGLIGLVYEFKPYQIVSVDDSIVTDVLSQLVPTLVISLTPSELRRTYAQYLQIGRPVNDDDRIKLKRRGKNEENVISGVFSSRLAEQKESKTADELGLPSGKPIGVVIGGRLNDEVKRDFLEMIRPCVEKGFWLLFLGDVSRIRGLIDEVMAGYTDRVICPGTVSDTLMYLEHCRIYLNPIRRGGGTSSVEAMSKGVVPLATAYGDVYTNVGDDFLVRDYGEMTEKACRLMEDEAYYTEMSRKAVARSERMIDSEGAFRQVMEEFEARMLRG